MPKFAYDLSGDFFPYCHIGYMRVSIENKTNRGSSEESGCSGNKHLAKKVEEDLGKIWSETLRFEINYNGLMEDKVIYRNEWKVLIHSVHLI